MATLLQTESSKSKGNVRFVENVCWNRTQSKSWIVEKNLATLNLMGIPIAVVDDDSVGCLEVKSETSRSGGEEEDEHFGRSSIKFLE